jgi:hypothetical protein
MKAKTSPRFLFSCAAVLGLALSQCGGSPQTQFLFGDGGTGGGGGGQGNGDSGGGSLNGDTGTGKLGSGSGGGGGGTGGDASLDCPPSAKLIYVTGEGSDLYSFNPENGMFTLIGKLTCLDSPTHMTVDRTGTAWVVSDGMIYKASTANASCAPVSTWTPDPFNFSDFALTFIGTTSATDTTLYLLSDTGELGAFNTITGNVTMITTESISTSGDMTTNGNGSLYFLQQSTTQTLNQINPTTGAIVQSWTTGLDSENTQALAYYGGLFYDFIGSAVSTYNTSTKAVTSLGNAPLMVTGAGQSTCVPTSAPPPPPLR